ncbi:60S ribosomal protein L21-A [Phyllosticta citrichinensis]|uniref:60S ribosomal protein L21-A n=1 Tax=Phyllosticta citrichinensis TaxID=1130410 RepID=A0ABR1XJ06_9PEZI
MGHSAGLRAGTRYAFSRGFKNHGAIPLSTYLRNYKVGDIVDVVANGAVQKGMPHKDFHGKTGVIYNVTKSAVGVILYKQVGNRYIEKRVNLRIEHVNHSRSRDEFLQRVKDNAAKRRAAKVEGKSVQLKRQPAQPRNARTVTMKDNIPETITPIPYDTHI